MFDCFRLTSRVGGGGVRSGLDSIRRQLKIGRVLAAIKISFTDAGRDEAPGREARAKPSGAKSSKAGAGIGGREESQRRGKRRGAKRASSAESLSSSEREQSAQKKKKAKRNRSETPEPARGKKKSKRASTWDMLAYLWPVSSRPAHLQLEKEVNR